MNTNPKRNWLIYNDFDAVVDDQIIRTGFYVGTFKKDGRCSAAAQVGS